MKIAVDIDDTLNVLDRAGKAGAYIARNRLPFRLLDRDANAFTRVFDWQSEDVVRFLRDGGISVFTDAPARKGGAEALCGWREEGLEVVILTARPRSWFVHPESISRDWLEKRRIPYDALYVEEEDKGRFCATHGIAVLVDDNVEHCLSMQRRGGYAVLALCKGNASEAEKIALGSANWAGIDRLVRRIAGIRTIEDRLFAARASSTLRTEDGWEYRTEGGMSRRNNCVRPVAPSLLPLEEKIARYERDRAEADGACRFRLTELDGALDRTLAERGYTVESRGRREELGYDFWYRIKQSGKHEKR